MVLYQWRNTLLSSLKSIATSGKDTTVSFAIRKIINIKAKKVGAYVKEFTINSRDKYIIATVFLEGEKDPLTIKASRYTITTKNEKHFLEVDEIQKSHEWDNSYIDGKHYKISPEVLKAAQFIL